LCSGSETGSYLRLIDLVYHSTLGLRSIKKKKGTLVTSLRVTSRGPVEAGSVPQVDCLICATFTS